MPPYDVAPTEVRKESLFKEEKKRFGGLPMAELSSIIDQYERLVNRPMSGGGERLDVRDYPLSSLLLDLLNWGELNQMNPNLQKILKSGRLEFTPEQTDKLQQTIEVMADLIDELTVRLELKKGIDTEFKLEWATFNQQISLFLYLANQPSTSPEDKLATDAFIEIMRVVSKSERSTRVRNIGEAERVSNVLDGARAQAGLIEVLEKNDFFVILPDWEDGQEVLDWDLSGVDFITISPKGEVIFVDSKGKRFDDEDGIKTVQRHTTSVLDREYDARRLDHVRDQIMDHLEGIPKDHPHAEKIKRALMKLENQGQNAIRWKEVRVPTDETIMTKSGIITDQSVVESLVRKLS